MDIVSLAQGIHIDNQKWWTDLQTGTCMLETRNRGDLMMLVVTEVVEAAEGLDGRPDDKLPHLPMLDCELADTAIRLLDLLGAEMKLGRLTESVLRSIWRDESSYQMDNMGREAALFQIVKLVAIAKEHERKERWRAFHGTLIVALNLTMRYNHVVGRAAHPILDVIEQKRAFNRVRVDHSIEHRRGADGKKS